MGAKKTLIGYIIPVYKAALDPLLSMSICFPFHKMENQMKEYSKSASRFSCFGDVKPYVCI